MYYYYYYFLFGRYIVNHETCVLAMANIIVSKHKLHQFHNISLVILQIINFLKIHSNGIIKNLCYTNRNFIRTSIYYYLLLSH